LLEKISEMVTLLQALTQNKANVDDFIIIYNSITNIMANVFSVIFGCILIFLRKQELNG
jgi:hypothetical protein